VAGKLLWEKISARPAALIWDTAPKFWDKPPARQGGKISVLALRRMIRKFSAAQL
jgi:hypothetical protein